MVMLRIIIEAVGYTLACLVAAALFNWCCWNVFKLFRLPEWGPPIGVIGLFAAFGESVASSEFLRRSVELATLGACILWSVGRDRKRCMTDQPVNDDSANGLSSASSMVSEHSIYPAIAACMGEARSPSRAEIRKVAKRIRREIYPDQPLGPSLRRAITHLAMAALGVGQLSRMGRKQRPDHLSSLTEEIGKCVAIQHL